MLSGCGRPRPHYNETLLLPDNEILTINYSLFTFLPLFGYYLVVIWLLFGCYLVVIWLLFGDSATHTLPISTLRAITSRSTPVALWDLCGLYISFVWDSIMPCTDMSVLPLKNIAISCLCKNVSSAYTARRVVNGILWVSTENKNNSYRSLMEAQSPNCKNVKLSTCQINIFSYLCKLLCAYPYIAHNYNTLSINNSHSNGDEIQSDRH